MFDGSHYAMGSPGRPRAPRLLDRASLPRLRSGCQARLSEGSRGSSVWEPEHPKCHASDVLTGCTTELG